MDLAVSQVRVTIGQHTQMLEPSAAPRIESGSGTEAQGFATQQSATLAPNLAAITLQQTLHVQRRHLLPVSDQEVT